MGTNVQSFFDEKNEDITGATATKGKGKATKAKSTIAKENNEDYATRKIESVPHIDSRSEPSEIQYMDGLDGIGHDYPLGFIYKPRYDGIRFDGFLRPGTTFGYGGCYGGSGFHYVKSRSNVDEETEKFNKRIEFIMNNYTGEAIARLSETTLATCTAEDLMRYINLLQSLLKDRICDIE